MNAQIIELPSKRISVKIDWNPDMHSFFKAIPKYFFSYDNKCWTFPSSYLEHITEHLEKNNYTIHKAEFKPLIKITQKENNIEVESEFHPDTYKIFSQFGHWCTDYKAWLVPNNKFNELTNELNAQKWDFTLTAATETPVNARPPNELPKISRKLPKKKLFN